MVEGGGDKQLLLNDLIKAVEHRQKLKTVLDRHRCGSHLRNCLLAYITERF